MVIEQTYSNEGLMLKRTQATNWSPTLNAVVTNLHNGQETIITEKFLIDSGASITVLGPSLERLFKESEPFDSIDILYGAGRKRLNVYKVKLTMQGGQHMEILAALDTTLQFKHHLLGMTKGLDYFDYLVLNNKHKTTKLVKKY